LFAIAAIAYFLGMIETVGTGLKTRPAVVLGLLSTFRLAHRVSIICSLRHDGANSCLHHRFGLPAAVRDGGNPLATKAASGKAALNN
jgi:hypothetical protein